MRTFVVLASVFLSLLAQPGLARAQRRAPNVAVSAETLRTRIVQTWSERSGRQSSYASLRLLADGRYEAMVKYNGNGTSDAMAIGLYASGENGTWALRENVLVLRPAYASIREYDVRMGATWLELRLRNTGGTPAPIERLCSPHARSVPNGAHASLGRRLDC